VGDWWSCRWSPVASQGAPPAAVRETHKAILWGGGMAAAIAVAPTAHRWWRGGRLGCRLVSSEKLDVGSGTPTEERGCGPWRIDQEVSVSAHDGKPSGGAPRHKEGWCWPSSAAACSPEPGARTNDSKGIEWVLSTSPPATWWRGT
jgi:hypothetical protein